jgi:cobaltochelatase CobS
MAKTKRYATCRHCGEQGLAWVRLPNTRYGQSGAYANAQAWILYQAKHDASGTILEDSEGRAIPTAEAHSCQDYTKLRLWMVGASSVMPDLPAAARRPSVKRRKRYPSSVQAPCDRSSSAPAPAAEEETEPEDGPDTDEDEEDEEEAPAPASAPAPSAAPAPAPAPSGDAAALIAQALALVSAAASKAVDEQKVRDIVAEAVAEALRGASRTETVDLEVVVRRPDGSTVKVSKAHPMLPRLIRRIKNRRHSYVYGLPGSGKTSGGVQAADLCGMRHAVIALSQTTTASQLFGFIDASSGYRPTILRDFFEHGGVLILDEFDNVGGNVATLLNGLLENGLGSFPDGMIERHKDFVVVATGNTNLRGANRNHSARTSLDLATVKRFGFLEWQYDEALESAIVTDVDEVNAPAILSWVRKVRAIITRDKIDMLLAGPREALNIAKDLMTGETFEDAAESWVWCGLDAPTRDRILRDVPYPSTRPSTRATEAA